ncbi:hypothetical protein BUALT_Bualt04G0121100 [Buddleja alternifolia]|uniref:TF-B3 domain-containing protein n=1 Tax=Buddleja alternifolia TaxID=168488 RepID=A0AAV6XSP6_9LAMI|nr:hypothetical protein BUALT_Bualt04G0121100 [Buddleja alternifolia]
MGRKPKRRPSFFKVIIKDDFIHHLRLPHGFVEKYGDILPENAKLRTDFGETYKVKLEQIEEEEEYCCFTQGWNKFALDIGLQIGEFLVFWYNIGKSVFDVSIYGITGCERKIRARINSLIEISDLGENVELDKELITYNSPAEVIYKQSKAGTDGAGKSDYYHLEEANPHFKIVLKEHRRSRVSVRKEFAITAGLMGEKAVVLKYESEQRHWPVLLEHNPNMKQFRLDIGAGWNEFWRKNGLAMGKSYLFEYIRDTNVIQVKQA